MVIAPPFQTVIAPPTSGYLWYVLLIIPCAIPSKDGPYLVGTTPGAVNEAWLEKVLGQHEAPESLVVFGCDVQPTMQGIGPKLREAL